MLTPALKTKIAESLFELHEKFPDWEIKLTIKPSERIAKFHTQNPKNERISLSFTQYLDTFEKILNKKEKAL